jgi:RNA-directed DNA polymerase
VVSPLLSNILLTPFDQEMRRKGCQLTRYADDSVVTCESAAEARAAEVAALRILNELGVQMHPQKTRIVHVREGFEFLGYKIKRGKQLRLPPGKIRSGAQSGALYALPREKSISHFMDQVCALTSRRVPLKTKELIEELNPVLRGWAITTSEPTSESSSTGSTVGSCDAFGRIDSSGGATVAGDSCRKPSCTASTGW